MHAPIAAAGNSLDQLDPAAFDGRLLGDVVRRSVFNDPMVLAGFPHRTMEQAAAYYAILGQKFYLFPMDFSLRKILLPEREIDNLDDLKLLDEPIPAPIEAALHQIYTSSQALLGLLRSKRIIVRDRYNNELAPAHWLRSDIGLDLNKSDLYDIGKKPWLQDHPDNKLFCTGLWLSLPNAATDAPNSVSAKLKAASPQGTPEKKKMPAKKKAAVVKALKKRKIRSKSDLDVHPARKRLAAEIVSDTKEFGEGQERVEAVRVMFTRLTDADFVAK
jgi:hypothetical protein